MTNSLGDEPIPAKESGEMDENTRAELSLKLVSGNILPRLGLILRSPALWVACVLALILALSIAAVPISKVRIDTLAGYGLSFASISLGACFTTAVLTLSLPGNDRIRKWSRARGEIPTSTPLSDLLFVITWAALIQVLLIFTCASAIVFGGSLQVFPSEAPLLQRLSIFLAGWVFFYAVIELLIVISTLSQVGNVIVHEERRATSQCEQKK